jgi:hypothetical protein
MSRNVNAAIALAVCALIALAPTLAEARAGSGRSMGSFGSSRGAATQPYSYSAPRPTAPRPAPSYRAPVARPSPVSPQFGSMHPFWSGMLGGFVGAGLAGMLFGHGFAPIGLSPGGAAIGLLLQLALIGGLVWFGLRLLRRP